MNYRKNNLVSTEYGILPIENIVFNHYLVKGYDGRLLWANKVDPVELTVEFLVKEAGFKYSPYSGDIKNTILLPILELKAEIEFEIYEKEIVCIIHNRDGAGVFRNIKYIHQFQDFYELAAGKELTLKSNL